ncbi:hypothetical protein TKK_0012494 [Trichogramma kaykai]
MNYYLLCNLDDLAKNILVDSRGKFNVRKMKPNRTLPFQVNVTSVSKRINEDFDVNQDINETTRPISFVNHDCHPNTEYHFRTSYSLQLKVIKNIKKGEEILVKYSDDYFGPNNEDCECTSCLNKSR